MTTKSFKSITVETLVSAPVGKTWKFWTVPEHIVQWCFASDDWHAPDAANDVRTGGKFSTTMAAKDGSVSFAFEGVYTKVVEFECIEYVLSDGRKVKITFQGEGKQTKVIETFDAEEMNSLELQQSGWQAILDNFKKHVEKPSAFSPQHFEVSINAPASKVYRLMLEEKTYKAWTAEFNPTSSYKGSWDKGSKILFVGTDADGKTGGMVSRIQEHVPNQFVSIEHLGMIQDGKEITSGPEVDAWSGATENYTYQEKNGKTLLLIDLDSNEELKAYFSETYPKALNKLKEICEA